MFTSPGTNRSARVPSFSSLMLSWLGLKLDNPMEGMDESLSTGSGDSARDPNLLMSRSELQKGNFRRSYDEEGL
jgi:hypothetical protein